jgi:aspartate aminotransferase-like enzyme
MKKNYMFTPGPTMVPAEVLLAEAAPMIHHRTPQFSAIIRQVTEWLKELFGTKEDVYIIAGSGTAAMEAAIVNTCSPGDRAICAAAGKFGERWGKICQAYGCDAKVIALPPGKSFTVDMARKALQETPGARVLCITHSETSTGALTDVEGIAALTRKSSTLLVVDSITGIGVHPMKMDEWGVDVVVTGSQKGLMLPPGLAFIAVSSRTWDAINKCTTPRYYLDLKAMKKNLEKDTTPFTPAISLIRALHCSLSLMRAEGFENIYARHARLAEAARAAMRAIGLKLVADCPANGVTAVWAPDGIDTEKMIKKARDEWGVTLTGGQDEMKGKLFRIGHMGYVSAEDMLVAVATVERALKEAGYKLECGKALAAANAVLFGGK